MSQLNFTEIFSVICGASTAYISVIYILSHFIIDAYSPNDFWGFLPSVWDHPEPNYVYLFWISEFFSVITAIPIAGYLLMYNAWKYQYSQKVVGLYCIIVTMYSFAFFAHSTLSPLLMSCTLSSVMTNGVYTFYQYSQITKIWFLQSRIMRAAIAIVAESVIIFTVIKLPYMLGEFGGVPTLTYVQTPAVSFATILVYIELNKIKSKKLEKKNENGNDMMQRKINVFELLLYSGTLLCMAMAVSFVEISMDRNDVMIFEHFPYLHVTIHILEQIGIYNYGMGVAALHHLVICDESKSKLCHVTPLRIPYIYRNQNVQKKKTKKKTQ